RQLSGGARSLVVPSWNRVDFGSLVGVYAEPGDGNGNLAGVEELRAAVHRAASAPGEGALGQEARAAHDRHASSVPAPVAPDSRRTGCRRPDVCFQIGVVEAALSCAGGLPCRAWGWRRWE